MFKDNIDRLIQIHENNLELFKRRLVSYRAEALQLEEVTIPETIKIISNLRSKQDEITASNSTDPNRSALLHHLDSLGNSDVGDGDSVTSSGPHYFNEGPSEA